jgi:DNA-binding response OmpR family regulator
MKKILLVNASRYFFEEGKSLLDRKDFQVFMAPSAKRALEIHREEQVNLIVAEIDLQDMGGEILCARIREESASKSVSLILICNDTPSDQARSKLAHANVCLKKPFNARTLLEHVEKLLTISTRRGYRVLLRAKVKGAMDDAVFFCTSQNLSVSGILIETDRKLAIGDQIHCGFFLPGASQITTDGEVARIDPANDGMMHCGIRFLNLPAAHQQAIEAFVSDSLLTAR